MPKALRAGIVSNFALRISIFAVLVSLLWFGAIVLRAAEHYVVTSGTHEVQAEWDYTSWGTAGTNIIDVVNVAMTNDAPRTVWVSNGVYVLTNQIVITNALTLQSIAGHGPDDTIINGGYAPGNPITNRCLLMSNASAFVSGLTFSNGASSYGGGVRMYGGVLSNCAVCNNRGILYSNGGGIHIYGGSIIGCLISNNIITNAACLGGGVYVADTPCTIKSSMICNNSAVGSDYGIGGGVYSYLSSWTMNSCTVTVNRASYSMSGGGVYCYYGGTITNSLISFNSGGGVGLCGGNMYNSTVISNMDGSGQAGYGAWINNDGMKIINCRIEGNSADGVYMRATGIISNSVIYGNKRGVNVGPWEDGKWGTIHNSLIANNGTNGGILIGSKAGGGATPVLVGSCTIVSNYYLGYAGSGIRIGATNANTFISSCVIYSNGVGGTDDVYDTTASVNTNAIKYSCVGANPESYFRGAGLIVANPQFKDFAGGNYRLAADSPCINTGSNENWMTNGYDLEGGKRIRYGVVDMGAYEVLRSGAIYSFH